ncbi:hypothetical protein BH09BAC5_BH09BAC5_05910 [soil metagenome]
MASGQFRFSHLGISQGLSQNSVHCIFQDSQGYIWLGTQDGLNRYDAYSFRTFRHNKNDSNSISDNFITGITEDIAHNLWIGTRNGVSRFDRKTEKFDQLFPDGMDRSYFHNAVRHIYKDAKGNIYFDSHGNFYCTHINAANEKYSISRLDRGYPVAFNFASDVNGNLFAADSSGIIEYENVNGTYPGSRRIFFDSAFSTINKSAFPFIDKKGRCWIVNEGKLFIYDILQNSIIRKKIRRGITTCITEDLKGNIWVGDENGVVVLNDNGDKIGEATNKSGANTTLSNNNVLSLYCDKTGAIWVGTAEGGVNLYNPFQDVFMTCRKEQDDEKSISDNTTWAIFQDEKTLFVGTSSGLNIFSLKADHFSNSKSFEDNVASRLFIEKDGHGKPLNNITSVVKVEENVYWVGTRNNGIVILNREGKIFSQVVDDPEFMSSNTIFHLLMAKDGTIWISTINGLNHFDFKSKNMEVFQHKPSDPNSLPGNYVISSYEDHEGKIWISTTAGLACYTPSTGKFRNYVSADNDKKSLSYNIVTSCMEDSKGRLWVTTLGGGINLFDPVANNFKSYTQDNGLSNNVVSGIGEGKNGELWMSSNAGISCFQPETETFKNYFPNDGIVSNEYSQNGFFKNKSNEIFFASPEGLLLFNPAAVSEKNIEPPVILTSYALNYLPQNAYSISLTNKLDLTWSQKTVSFEFAALDFTSAEKLIYSYKLEGFDNEWVTTNPGQRIATYTSLPFGKYYFKVRVRKNGESWSKEYLNILVNVIPPFWFSWWFIAGEIIIGLVLLILIIRYYSQRKLRKRLGEIEVQRKVQFERERISRDLHDNVGAHLTYIIQSLDNISYKIEKNPAEKSTEKIDYLGDFARGTMQQLRETIWAINKEEIAISALKEKIQEHLSRLSEAINGIHFSVEMVNENELILKPSQAIHIFRLVQEAVNNAIKHSGSDAITVRIVYQHSGNLIITVSDNGKGFNVNENFEGHYGLVNMRSRIEEIGGKLNINSTLTSGTEIIFEVPV